MKWILDSSALITLGKLRILEKVIALRRTLIVPRGVYQEAVEQGIERGASEAEYIKTFIQNKALPVLDGKEKATELFEEVPFLSDVDKEVLALAKEQKGIAIIDEARARSVAERFAIEYHGVMYILLKLLEEKKITRKEAILYVDEMIRQGFYLSREKHGEMLETIERIVGKHNKD